MCLKRVTLYVRTYKILELPYTLHYTHVCYDVIFFQFTTQIQMFFFIHRVRSKLPSLCILGKILSIFIRVIYRFNHIRQKQLVLSIK